MDITKIEGKPTAPIVIRYDLYKRPTTPRLPFVFVQSFPATEEGNINLFKIATKAFRFDNSELLAFINTNQTFNKHMYAHKMGLIVKVFSNSSPKQRLEAEETRMSGLYGKHLEGREEEKKVYEGIVQGLLKLLGGAAISKQ